MRGDHRDHGDVRPVGPDEVGRDPARPSTRRSTSPPSWAGARTSRRAGETGDRSTSWRRPSPKRSRRARSTRSHAACRLAIEPSLRTDVSFVHTLRDGTDVAERAGIDVIADLGNCWMERDVEDTVRRAGSRIAVVQFSDAVFGTIERPVARRPRRAGRRRPRTRRLHRSRPRRGVHGRVRARGRRARDRGRGTRCGTPAERRAGQHTAARGPPVSRAIVFNGDETWEERDLPVPEPQPGGAVLRVEATGLCHSDFDHFQGRVHTPWGGEFPSIAGHEIVGRIETHRSGGRPEWGVDEGDRVAVRDMVVDGDGFRIYGHDFSVDEGSGLYGGFAEHLELLPGSMVYRLRDDRPGRGAHHLRAVELRGDVGAPDRRQATSCVIEGPGHMGMATIVAARAGGRGDGHRHRRLAGSIPPRHRVARRCRSRDRRRAGGPGRARRRDHRRAAWPTS